MCTLVYFVFSIVLFVVQSYFFPKVRSSISNCTSIKIKIRLACECTLYLSSDFGMGRTSREWYLSSSSWTNLACLACHYQPCFPLDKLAKACKMQAKSCNQLSGGIKCSCESWALDFLKFAWNPKFANLDHLYGRTTCFNYYANLYHVQRDLWKITINSKSLVHVKRYSSER